MSSLRPQHDTTDQGLKTRNLLPHRPEAGRPRSGVSTARSLVRALFPETAVSPVTSWGRERALPPPKHPTSKCPPTGVRAAAQEVRGTPFSHHRPHQSSPSFGPITCSLPKTLSCARGLSLCPPLWGWTLSSTSALRTGHGTPVQVCWDVGGQPLPLSAGHPAIQLPREKWGHGALASAASTWTRPGPMTEQSAVPGGG